MAQPSELKRRVDRTIEQLARQLKLDLFDGIIVSVVKEWLDCSDSVAELNDAIHRRLQQVWPATERKIKAAFADLEEALKADLGNLSGTGAAGQLDAEVVGRGVSAPIANVIGAVTTLIGGTLLGGAETALLLEGPVGWVIGAVLVGVIYFFGKDAVQRALEPWIRNRRIPRLFKRGVRSRITTELTVTAQKFEHELHRLITEAAAPLYKAIEEAAA